MGISANWTSALYRACASCSRRMNIFTCGWRAFTFCQKCYGVHEWMLLRKVDGKRFTNGMTSSVVQFRALRFLPVGLHVVCVVPQQLVHFSLKQLLSCETDWSTLFMSDAWQHACRHKVLMLKVWLGCKRLNLSYWMLIKNCILYWLLQ
jgi:hypothetical protein